MPQPAAQLSLRTTQRRRGFSFTEILFAVMILGIGFIMVAAIFPVALRQTETSQAETVGAAVARAGVSFISQNSTTTFVDQSNITFGGTIFNFPVLRPTITQFAADDYNVYKACLTGTPAIPPAPFTSFPEIIGDVWSFEMPDSATKDVVARVNGTTLGTMQTWRSIVWSMMSQNMIQASDPRYAWVAFYRRNLVQTAVGPPVLYAYAPTAQLIVIALQSQGKQFYDESDLLLAPGAGNPVSIQPSLGGATITAPGLNNLSYTIQFADNILKQRAAEGAFVIIASDNLAPGTALAGTLNGHIYRLGSRVSGTTDTWEFAPGFGPIGTTDTTFAGGRTFLVYMVGKAQDPTDPTQYSGLAQDVAAYSTFISSPGN